MLLRPGMVSRPETPSQPERSFQPRDCGDMRCWFRSVSCCYRVRKGCCNDCRCSNRVCSSHAYWCTEHLMELTGFSRRTTEPVWTQWLPKYWSLDLSPSAFLLLLRNLVSPSFIADSLLPPTPVDVALNIIAIWWHIQHVLSSRVCCPVY